MTRTLDLYTDSRDTLARMTRAIDLGVSRHYSFRVAPHGETPDLKIGKSFGWGDERWNDIEINTTDWSVYAYVPEGQPAIVGCCLGRAVTVLVRPEDSDVVLRNRLLHEIIHAEDLDADGMENNLDNWLPGWLHWLFWRTLDRFRNFWEWQYYRWLMRQVPE